jgi:adenylate cyclase
VKLRRLVLDEKDLQLTDQRSVGTAPTSAGEEKRLAILFSDIRGFTPFAEALPPFDVVHVLNRYFNDMGVVINRNGGQIDNYMGDGLMALFGIDNESGAALRAVNAGLEMIAATEQLKPYSGSNLREELSNRSRHPLRRGGRWRDWSPELETSNGNRRRSQSREPNRSGK